MQQIAELTGLPIEKVRLIVHLVHSRKIGEPELVAKPLATMNSQELNSALDELVDYYDNKL